MGFVLSLFLLLPASAVVTFKWNGSRFGQTSLTTELTDCGKRAGKKLKP